MRWLMGLGRAFSTTRTLAFLLGLAGLLTGTAYAACSSPAGTAGDQMYSTTNNTMVFCNGTNWVSMAGGSYSGGGNTSAAGSSGDVQYNSGNAFSTDSGVFTYSGGVLKATTISTTNAYANTASYTTLYIGGVQYTGGGGGGATPGGSNTHIQYNNNGVFAGSSNLTYMVSSSYPFLGIGFTAPTGVGVAVEGMGQMFTSGTVGGFFTFDRSVGTGFSGLYRQGGIGYLYDSTAGNVIQYTSSTKVGIGTAPTGYALTVSGDIIGGSGSFLRTSGSTGWYNDTYAGGWYMADTTWLRSVSGKAVYTGGVIRADGGFNVGGNAGVTGTWYEACWNSINLTGGLAYSFGGNTCDGDIAEHYGTEETVLRGDIVMLGTTTTSRDYNVTVPSPAETSKTTYTITTANVRKATFAGRERLFGAVPTAPTPIGFDKIDPKDKPQLIALVGHVPVHMTLEGGPVAIGDPITVAKKTPGAGMKATTSGRILGYALEPYAKIGDSKDDMIEVFIHLEDWVAPADHAAKVAYENLKVEMESYMKSHPRNRNPKQEAMR